MSPATFRRIADATTFAFAAIIVTGGAVRLTGSGLGCPDWPGCYQHHAVAVLSVHPMVEFGNRCVTIAVGILTGATIVAAWLRQPRRRELLWLSVALLGGIVAQAIMGGIVVLTKLNPYFVMTHFLLSLAVVATAVYLSHRARVPDGLASAPAVPVVDRPLVWLARLLLGALCVVVTVGTAVSGAGPHTGDPSVSVSRVPLAFQEVAELHSTLALFLIGLTLASLFAFRQARAPERVQARGRVLLEVMAVQGALGYTQYFLHDNPLVVGIHMLGATGLFVASVWFYLSLFERREAKATPITRAAAAGADAAKPRRPVETAPANA